MMPSSVTTKFFVLLFGLAYPSYCSFKAIHRRDSKQYAQWLIYWIVFSLFLSSERIFDHFVIWIPFYYEIKILVTLWLVSPATKGSTLFYARWLHPFLVKREQDIDTFISGLNSLGYSFFKNLLCHAFYFVLAMLGQVHYGILEVIKKQYNLKEIKAGLPIDEKSAVQTIQASNVTQTSQKSIIVASRPTTTTNNNPKTTSGECSASPVTKKEQTSSRSLSTNTTTPQKPRRSTTSSSSSPHKRTITSSPSSATQKTTSSGTRKIQPPPSSSSSSATSKTQTTALPASTYRGRPFNPEPGSYFDRFLRPRQKPSTSGHSSQRS